MNVLWLLILLPVAAAIACALTGERLATAIARATATVSAALTTLVALSTPIGASATLPWLPQRGLHFALALDALAIPGILTVAWTSALACAHARGKKLGLLLAAQACALVAWLAADLGTMVAAWSLLALLAALMVSRSRQSVLAVFLPLSAAALALMCAALLLALSHHEATLGHWSFGLQKTLTVLSPAPQEAMIAAFSLVAAWFMAGLWPLHGWWQSAALAAPPAFGAWLPAVLRPLGIGLLVRVTLPAAAASMATMASTLGIVGALILIVGLLGASSEPVARRRYLHLAHVPTAVALIGVATFAAEGIGGALLLGLAGGLAFALVHLAGPPKRPFGTLLTTVGLLGLLGAPGLLGFAAVLPIALALLGPTTWMLSGAAALGLLLLGAVAIGIAPLIASARDLQVNDEAASPSRHSPRRAGLLALAAGLLVLLGVMPSLVQDRVNAAAPPLVHRAIKRWCESELSPLLRAREAGINPTTE
ncbi:MAG TPA: hypothetical protein ENJ18_08820, partial [Nannocystis exedens]|nr:hypothetical protein [Nannocystis exedens]